jgi:hypothetical protein
MTYGFNMGDLVWAGISRPKMGVVVGFDTAAFGYLQAVLVVWIIELSDSYRFLAEDCRVVDPDINCPGTLRST